MSRSLHVAPQLECGRRRNCAPERPQRSVARSDTSHSGARGAVFADARSKHSEQRGASRLAEQSPRCTPRICRSLAGFNMPRGVRVTQERLMRCSESALTRTREPSARCRRRRWSPPDDAAYSGNSAGPSSLSPSSRSGGTGSTRSTATRSRSRRRARRPSPTGDGRGSACTRRTGSRSAANGTGCRRSRRVHRC